MSQSPIGVLLLALQQTDRLQFLHTLEGRYWLCQQDRSHAHPWTPARTVAPRGCRLTL